MAKLQDIAFYKMMRLAEENANKLRKIMDMLVEEDMRLFAKAVDILEEKK